MTLGACSSLQSLPQVDKIASVFGGSNASAPAAPAAEPASQPTDIDDGTSAVIHPEIWPKGESGLARDPAVEAQVAQLLSQMSVEEKVGQIIMPDINTVTADDIRNYHIGSVLNNGDSGPHGNDRALPPEWLKLADENYAASVNVAPGKPAIPLLWGIDAVHGNSNIIGATLFPHNIGLGAMHDPGLVQKIGEITAQEVRVMGSDWTFAPTIAVVRDDRWGRTYEGFSEDPSIVTQYASAIITGLQGIPGDPDFLKGTHVIATAKHYIGDGGTDDGIDQGDNLYSEAALRDIFAPPYEVAVKVGVQSVMASYSSWRGQKMHGNKALLSDVLVGRLGFDGLVVGDYNGYSQLPGCSKTDCPQALLAGQDIYMTSDGWRGLFGNLVAEVNSGRIPMARLDEAASRVLRVKLRGGLMSEGKPSSRPFAGRFDLLGSPDHRALARQAVRESLVLLKNDAGLLPLSPRAHVLVTGDGADNLPKQSGGWTISWQGHGNKRSDFPNGSTIFEGIKASVEAAGGTATLSVDGQTRTRPDVAIVVFGEDPYAEGSGDRPNVDYPHSHDLRLLQQLKAEGIPVVSIFLSGRPLYVTPEINASDAFIAAWLPGGEGEGVSDVLFTKPDGSVAYDFRGRLSFSWPRAPDQTALNVGTEPYYPLFAYGYGLDYAHPRNLGPLPEAPVVVTSSEVNRDEFVAKGLPPSSRSNAQIDGAVKVRHAASVAPGHTLRGAHRPRRASRKPLWRSGRVGAKRASP
ncbi:MAG: glycoside hydrolase family 3 protein [Rhizomicrobium sp.]